MGNTFSTMFSINKRDCSNYFDEDGYGCSNAFNKELVLPMTKNSNIATTKLKLFRVRWKKHTVLLYTSNV